MPKPKLTPEQREALKNEIKELANAGTPTPQLLIQVSEKFGLTTEAIRWYMKGLGIKGKPGRRRGRKPKAKKVKKAKGRKRGRPRKARKAARRGRKRGPGRPKGSKTKKARKPAKAPSAPGRLMKIARLFSSTQLRKLAAVQSLIPKYDSLKRVEKTLQKKLKAVAKKAQKLGGKIRKLSLV